MKTPLQYIFLHCMALLGVVSCQTIDPADRYLDVPVAEMKRTVLVEEFTGQRCINCANGHDALAGIIELYGRNVVVVGIHAGGQTYAFAEGQNPNVVGLMQPEGPTYAKALGVDAFPAAVVNRVVGPTTNTAEWQTIVAGQLKRTSTVDLAISASVGADSLLTVSGRIATVGAEGLRGNLQLWVTESNIKAVQLMPTGKNNKEYIHNHVYRASINGVGGEPLSLTRGNEEAIAAQIKIKPNWAVDNLAVVAFYYTEKDGVMQAAECKVTK